MDPELMESAFLLFLFLTDRGSEVRLYVCAKTFSSCCSKKRQKEVAQAKVLTGKSSPAPHSSPSINALKSSEVRPGRRC